MRRSLARAPAIILAFVLVACSAKRVGGEHPSVAPSDRPRLAVVIVVDGVSWSRLESWRPWYTAGMKRLLDEGAVDTECRYGHLNTETGPGHASIATGAPPRVHGIALNQWYVPSADGSRMETVYSASDPQAVPGAKPILGPGRLLVPTLGDRLTTQDPRAKVVSISIKDRSAIFMAGRDRRHAAYWYVPNDATFTTSAAYDATSSTGAAAAAVVARFNAEKAGSNVASRYGTIVNRLPVPQPSPQPSFVTGFDAYQDAAVGHGFPKDLTKATKPLETALLWTPLSDRILADLALDLLADDALALGRDDVPDILWVSFSANDYVSHYYGPESEEALEILRGLDVQLGRLLDALTRRFGRDAVVVALSADHGMLPLPEATRGDDPGSTSARVGDTSILKELNAAVDAESKLDPGAKPVYRFEGCSLWLDRALLARPGSPEPSRVLDVVRRELATTWKNAIERTIVVSAPFPDAGGDPVLASARNAVVPGRSGDLLAVPRPGVLIDPYGGTGTSHGTPWEYDTHVPLIFWGGGIAARAIADPSTPYDLAPTVAGWLGVTMPDATGTSKSVREPEKPTAR
jgi:predicted AlkP superfamily pyrophosphatase or phosphodiesterase